ncbi:hypothetical protein AMS68_002378 [Peltaster fructicola]|uniref:DUF654-domain-containing protein n=1 Tax=Peltaster fructicola TaxID=286661 RepID=A0A6H0XQD3_9PEZI|nr:hypothetical protein AMS68_002378 [Peltaster fructicola]
MSSRALRKAQREKEEQARVEAFEAEDESDDQDEGVPVAPKKSAFAMLEQADDDDGEELPEDQPANAQTPNDRADDMDEIDAALRELAMDKSATTANTAADTDPTFDDACKLLAVDRNFLHAQNEMRKLFGRAALEQDDEAVPEDVGGNRRQQRRVQQQGLAQALRGQRGQGRSGMASLGLRRNIFIQGKEEWPTATGGGLGMEIVNKSSNGTVEYRYIHNRVYQDVQSQFESCVASMDPNRLVVLLQHNPYHISTLLQVSEIAKSERDHTTSGDLLERALISMGRAVHSTFAKTLAEGKARMDFRRPENREFWLASWRYMQNLGMRGTWRTVYEWARLLLALSPEEDPYTLWLTLDQYALRSKQDLDYLNLSRNALFKHVHEGMPNVLLSQGLAEYRSGKRAKGQQALFSTIGQYPWFIARLMHELDLNAPPAVWGKEPTTEKERLYAELYAVRAKDIWNTPENSSLLVEIASAVPAEAKQASALTEEIHLNEARHTILSDTPALIAMIPKKLSSQYTSVSDPLPPPDSINSYATTSSQTQGIGSVEEYREFQQLNTFFRSLLPRLMGGADANADNAELDEGARQRLADHGISEAELMQRLTRMRDLGGRDYMPALEAVDDAFDEQSEDDHQAHVEDVSDHGD